MQKGNAPVERKIQRLFRRGEACRLIKRCNDFGAGGVSVAVGELADGLLINLDKVPKKYEGLDGTELAIAESQERMAVALAAEDVEAFVRAGARGEPRGHAHRRGHGGGARAHDVARQTHRGREPRVPGVSNGAPKRQRVRVPEQGAAANALPRVPGWDAPTLDEGLRTLLADLNVCCNKGLVERFDSTIGAATVLMPFGGARQLTPAQAMVAKFPVDGETTTCSGMAWGFNPYLSEADQFVGAYVAVVESVAKLVGAGFSACGHVPHVPGVLREAARRARALGQARWRRCWARSWRRWTWAWGPLAGRIPCRVRSSNLTCRPRW